MVASSVGQSAKSCRPVCLNRPGRSTAGANPAKSPPGISSEKPLEPENARRTADGGTSYRASSVATAESHRRAPGSDPPRNRSRRAKRRERLPAKSLDARPVFRRNDRVVGGVVVAIRACSESRWCRRRSHSVAGKVLQAHHAIPIGWPADGGVDVDEIGDRRCAGRRGAHDAASLADRYMPVDFIRTGFHSPPLPRSIASWSPRFGDSPARPSLQKHIDVAAHVFRTQRAQAATEVLSRSGTRVPAPSVRS